MNVEPLENSARAVPQYRRAIACAGAAAVLASVAGCGGSSLPTVDVPNSIAVADVNGDGAPDLLVAATADQGSAINPGFASVILGSKSSPGTFQTGVHYGTTSTDSSSIAVADLTGPAVLTSSSPTSPAPRY